MVYTDSKMILAIMLGKTTFHWAYIRGIDKKFMSDQNDVRRVVVTGISTITPFGIGIDSFWHGITHGNSCISLIKRFDTGSYPVRIAGTLDIENYHSHINLGNKFANCCDINTIYAIIGTKLALEDSELKLHAMQNKIGVILGTGIGSEETRFDTYQTFNNYGWKRMSPLVIPKMMQNNATSLLSLYFGLNGINYTISSACSSSSISIANSYEMIKHGVEDIIITGGSDIYLFPAILGAWNRLRILSKDNNPATASKPFDSKRDGIVLSEGCGILVLEELKHALNRKAFIYGEVIGSYSNNSASNITKPDLEGIKDVMKNAIRTAELEVSDIDYINAHGTSTKINDYYEIMAIKEVFQSHAKKVPISSIKSSIGHTMGASGAIEAISVLLSLKTGIIPPTINYTDPDKELDLDFVPNKARSQRINIALSNSFGFGGSNCSLIIKKYSPDSSTAI